MGYSNKQKWVRAYRGQIVSPGRPTVAWREGPCPVLGSDRRGKEDKRRGCRCGRV